MAAETIKSTYITNLDATPYTQNTTGEGAPGSMRQVDGYCPVTAVGIVATTSTYRLLRIPTTAKIKSVDFGTDVAIDSNSTQTLALDFNLVFSDSTIDGTPLALQGLIPTTANTGATTTFASYASPNIIFGTKTLSGNNAAIPLTNITYSGTIGNYNMMKLSNTPLWSIFGFVNAQGVAADPGGFFDLVAYVSVVAATGHAGNIYARVSYVI